MKKIFLLMKLKAEFIALIGSRLSENQRKQVSSAIDSIFRLIFHKCLTLFYHAINHE